MASGDETPTFSSDAEAASYWKGKAGEWKKTAEASKDELDEFQEGSKELEHELETQLEQEELKNKDLKSLTNRLQLENEQLRDKLEQCSRDYHFQINELETELAEIKGIKDKLHRYVRELEQQNDDLERAKRSTLASLEDFEGRMNNAIERNAYLESELDEKDNLKAAVQRLKDETRDLRSELKVLNPQVSEDEEPDNDKQMAREEDSNKKAAATPPKLTNGFSSSHQSVPTPPLTPSARISALGIVGDLLRKVGALELKLGRCKSESGDKGLAAMPAGATKRKLVSCRNIVKENGKENGEKGAFSSLNGIDRSRRIPRGASSPAVKALCESSS